MKSFGWLFAVLPLLAAAGADLPPSFHDTVRVRVAPLDVSAFGDETVSLAPFPDVAIDGVRDRLEAFGPESFAWVGHAAGDDSSSIVLSVTRGTLSASLRVSSGQYRVRPAGAGLYRIEQVQPAAEPPDQQPLSPDAARAGGRPVSIDNGGTLDLLVVYTKSSRMATGGRDAIESLVHLGVAETNVAFERSGVETRLRLVGLEELSYQEAGRAESDLEILQRDNDGALDEVHALRDASGADFVQLVVEERDGCGIAYSLGSDRSVFADWAFSVVERGCIDSTYAMAHELGHNFGSDHAPEDPTTRAAFGFSHGYKDLLAGIRTIMAYGPGVRVPLFSSPRVLVRGLAAGTEEQDNARSIQLLRTTLAGFRESVPPPRLLHVRQGATGSIRFRLERAARGVVEWRLFLGTARGAADLFDSGTRSAGDEAIAPASSLDRRPIHARLWYRRGHVWLHDDLVL